jgi:hypothetical protein
VDGGGLTVAIQTNRDGRVDRQLFLVRIAGLTTRAGL